MPKRQDYYVYQQPNTSNWWVYYTHPASGERIRHSLETTDKYLARKAAKDEWHASYEEAKTGARVSWTVNKLLDWATNTIWQETARLRDLPSLLRPLRESIGHLIASNARTEDILKFRADRLRDGKAISTIKHPLHYLAAAYEAAICDEKLVKNPVKITLKKYRKLFPTTPGRKLFLNRTQQSMLLEACKGILRSIVKIALRTGMRQGEILRLRWDDINFEKMELRTWSQKGSEKRFKERYIPLLPDVVEELKSLPRIGKTVYCYKEDCVRPTPKRGVQAVFKRGDPLSKWGAVHTSFMRTVEKLAQYDPIFKGFRFHDLRHTFASEMINLGVDVDTIREIVGHADVDMTRVYAHLTKQKLVAAMNLLPRLPVNLPVLSIVDEAVNSKQPKMLDNKDVMAGENK